MVLSLPCVSMGGEFEATTGDSDCIGVMMFFGVITVGVSDTGVTTVTLVEELWCTGGSKKFVEETLVGEMTAVGVITVGDVATGEGVTGACTGWATTDSALGMILITLALMVVTCGLKTETTESLPGTVDDIEKEGIDTAVTVGIAGHGVELSS